MIYISTLNRKWNPGKELLKEYPHKAQLEFDKYIALKYVKEIKKAIYTQSMKWTSLNPKYISYKKRKGLSTKIWESTYTLRDNLKVIEKFNRYEVGWDKNLKNPISGESVLQISKYLEYGTIDIPPRPLFRVVFKKINSNLEFYKEEFLKSNQYSKKKIYQVKDNFQKKSYLKKGRDILNELFRL